MTCAEGDQTDSLPARRSRQPGRRADARRQDALDEPLAFGPLPSAAELRDAARSRLREAEQRAETAERRAAAATRRAEAAARRAEAAAARDNGAPPTAP